MSKIPLNKFEKCDLLIKLHKEGHPYREIAHSSRTCKAYKTNIKKMSES